MFCAKRDFDRNVLIEVHYLKQLYGDAALEVAKLKAERPRLRSWRRRILRATARRIERETRGSRGLLGLPFGGLATPLGIRREV